MLLTMKGRESLGVLGQQKKELIFVSSGPW